MNSRLVSARFEPVASRGRQSITFWALHVPAEWQLACREPMRVEDWRRGKLPATPLVAQ